MRTKGMLAAFLVATTMLSGCGVIPGMTPAKPTPQSSTPSSPPSSPLRAVPQANYVVENCGVSGSANSGKASNVLLTIDDFPIGKGKPSGEKMIQIADWARATGIMMEAFPIKSKVNAYQDTFHVDLVSELRTRGTYVSNHSYSHPQLTKLSEVKLEGEIRKGVSSTYLRPPYGDFNPAVKKAAEANGYRLCTWTIDTNDWRLVDGKAPSPEELVRRVHTLLAATPPGSPVVILGHYFTNYPLALQGIVDDVARLGARMCPAPPVPVTEAVPFPLC